MKIKRIIFILVFLSLFACCACRGNIDDGQKSSPLSKAEIVDEMKHSIVQIISVSPDFVMEEGSGVIKEIKDNETYIITNYHVIKNAEIISVKFFNSDNYVNADVVGYEVYYDICVIKVNYIYERAKPFEFATKLQEGQELLSLGYNNYQFSAYDGIVSCKDKLAEIENRHLLLTKTTVPFLRGCSGGATINLEGQLIGINSYVYVNYIGSTTVQTGLSLCVPYMIVESIYDRIITSSTPSLGISINDDFTINIRLGFNILIEQTNEGLKVLSKGQSSLGYISIEDKIIKVNDVAVEKGNILEILSEIIRTGVDTVFII